MTENLLPGFEPSEADLVKRALAQPLEDKIRRSIGLLQMYETGALRLSPEGYYLAFSGGKDSCVIKQLAIEAGVKFKAYYNNTTIDPPELIRFIREKHGEVTWNNPKKGMMQRALEKPLPPTRKGRWCCEEYKHKNGATHGVVIGVRISESANRAAFWREFNPRHHNFELAPIAYWTDEDVWNFIHSRKVPYCELYDQGFKRLGCVGCPLNSSAQEFEFNRWPRFENMWKRTIMHQWKIWHDKPRLDGGERVFLRSFKNGEELWDWWRSGKASEGRAGCVYEEIMMNV